MSANPQQRPRTRSNLMFKPAQKIPEQRPPERPSGASPRSAAPAGDGHQIHVRGIGVDGWDGTHEGRGDYENEAALRSIFGEFGSVQQVVVRHRVQGRKNTSWALVAMGDEEAVERVMAAPSVMAGTSALVLNRFSTTTAATSTGAMKIIGKRSRMTEEQSEAANIDVLREVPLFAGLSTEQLFRLSKSLVRTYVCAGEKVITQGETGHEMFVVESGRLEASVITPEGKDIGIVKTYGGGGGGEFFGELALLTDAPRSATVTATDECSLLVLQRSVVQSLLIGGGSDEADRTDRTTAVLHTRQKAYAMTIKGKSEDDDEAYCCGAPGVIIHPGTPFCRAKEQGLILVIMYSAIWEPYKAAFAEDGVTYTALEYIVDAFYWIDICLSFIIGYEDQFGQYELSFRKIVPHYLTGWFVIDFVATFNWEWFLGLFGFGTSTMRLLRLLRTVRLFKAVVIVDRLRDYLGVRTALVKIIQFVLGLMIVIHIIACVFYLVPTMSKLDHESESYEDSPWAQLYANDTIGECHSGPVDGLPHLGSEIKGPMTDSWVCDLGISRRSDTENSLRYLTACYFSITTISTIGYGDISPNLLNETELLFTIIAEFVGMFLFSYVVSNMAGLVGNLNVEKKEFQERLDRHLEYMRDKKTPEHLKARVLRYLNYMENSSFALREQDETLLSQLSPGLRVEMRQSFYVEHLRKIHCFQEQGSEITWKTMFTEELALCIEPIVALPGDLIVHRGELGREQMFVIMSGAVETYGNSWKKKQTIDSENPYPFFGVSEMFATDELAKIQHRSVKAKGPIPCDLARISKGDFEQAAALYPEAWEELKAFGDSELDNLLSMDVSVTKKELQTQFNLILGDVSPRAPRRITKQQVAQLASSLEVELAEPMLSRAMQMMDAEKTVVTGERTPVLTVNFDSLYRWWTAASGNFTDPEGLCGIFTAHPVTPSASRKSVDAIEQAMARGQRRGQGHPLPAAGEGNETAVDEINRRLDTMETDLADVRMAVGRIESKVGKKFDRLEMLLLKMSQKGAGSAVEMDTDTDSE